MGQPMGSPSDARPAVDTASPGQGIVSVRTERGWADVYYRGRLLGRTPLRVELPAGRQRLRLLPQGREPAAWAEVQVRHDRVQHVNLSPRR